MRALVPVPAAPHSDWFDRILARKRNQDYVIALAAVRPAVLAQYALLEAAGDGDAVASVASEPTCALQADALKDCYDGSTVPLRELVKEIKVTQPAPTLKYCPMCGTTIPRSIDHYLPKEDYPEFSVHPLNLVPCCSTCNSAKGKRLLNKSGKRMFRNAYQDDWSAHALIEVVLHTHTNPVSVGATFQLVDPGDATVWELAKSHFEELHLLDVYAEFANDEISEILGILRARQKEGPVDAGNLLGFLADETEAAHGASHWRVALMRGMASHPDLQLWVDEIK